MFEKSKELFDECIKELDCKWNNRVTLTESIYHYINNNINTENIRLIIETNYNTPKQYYTNKLEADAFRNEAMLMVQSFFPSLMIRYILSNDDPNVELKELVNDVINYILSHVLAKNPSLKNFMNYTSEKELKKLKKDVCEYSKRVFFVNSESLIELYNNHKIKLLGNNESSNK